MGGKQAFGIVLLEEAIADGVGNGMTVSQFFDPNVNNDAQLAEKAALQEAYKQKVLARLLVLNCRHKSVRSEIQLR